MILICIIFFILGALVGSFLNVVILRLPRGEEIIKHRSHCPKCKKTLSWWELVPIISYILLYGRCRNCGDRISPQYILVELATAILFLVLYLNFGLTFFTGYLLIVTCFLIVIFVYDLKHMEIPDEVVYPLIALALIVDLVYIFSGTELAHPAGMPPTSIYSAGLGLVLGGGIFAILVAASREKWMGIGDVKLGIGIGLFLGWPIVLVGIFGGFFVGSIVALILLALGKARFGQKIAFAPYLIVGTLVAIFWGQWLIDWYLGFSL